MPNAWRIHLEPTIVYLTPKGGGNFAVVTSAPGATVPQPKGSFPVVISVRINITDDGKGPPPLQPGDPGRPATLELMGRALRQSPPPSPADFVSLGVLKG